MSRLDSIFAGWGNRPSSQIVSSRGGGGRSQGQQQAYDDRIRRENQAMLTQYQQQMQAENDRVNAANQKQYAQLMSTMTGMQGDVLGSGGTYAQMEGLMAQMGVEGNARISDQNTRNLAKSKQSLGSRGLGNTTIVDSATRGINADTERNRQSLSEQVALGRAGVLGQKAGAQQNIGRLMADSILSRQNVGPNQDMYAQMISQMFSA